MEAPRGIPSPIVSNHPSFICSYWLGICYQISPKWSPPGKVPFRRDPDECWVGIQGQQARSEVGAHLLLAVEAQVEGVLGRVWVLQGPGAARGDGRKEVLQ